jgi:hypothetical protein
LCPNLIADKESRSDGQKDVHLLLLLFGAGFSPVGSVLYLLKVSLHTLLALSWVAARTSYPRGHGDGTEDVEVGDTSHLTIFSINGEHASDTL